MCLCSTNLTYSRCKFPGGEKCSGYIAPEYAMDGQFLFKSDIFCFDVVLLEVVSGRRSTGFYQPERCSSLLGYASNLWKEDKAMELLDKNQWTKLAEQQTADRLLWFFI
ncbi:G-type lectin S-receptor-like serine/threonine-protein kinase At4g03230 [Linum grandiflorum]